jgi:hypothetical protein
MLPQPVSRMLLALILFTGLLSAPSAIIAQTPTPSSPNRGVLVFAPDELYAGHIVLGRTATMTCTISNRGSSSVTISKATSSNPVFRVLNLRLPTVLAPNQSTTFTVQFLPRALEYVIASVAFTSNASEPNATLLLHGTGVRPGKLVASLSPIFFGKVPAGGRKQLTLAVTNAGYSDVTISAQSLSGSPFQVRGLNLPLTLGPAESITFGMTFTPIYNGVVRGSLSLASTATNPSLTVPVFGTGLVSVSLAWNASSSAVAGYNVYRSRILGGPYHKLTAAPELNTSYTDNGIFTGNIYYYVVTSVDPQGLESSYSNQAVAVVP